jgi:polyhydroxybutyrate depolymerase
MVTSISPARWLRALRTAFAAVLLTAPSAYAQSDAGDGGVPANPLSRTVSGFPNRPYLLHLPGGSAPSAPAPVVLVLHGGAGSAAGMRQITCPNGDLTSSGCMDALADREGFYSVYPSGTPSPFVPNAHTWNAGGGTGTWECVSGLACSSNVDDIAYFNALLDDLAGSYPVDPRRVFATGFSDGAAMTHRLGCELSSRIAAIAPIAGGNQYETSAPCSPGSLVPVLEMHGTADPCWAFDGGTAACLAQDGKSKVDIPGSVAAWAQIDDCTGPPAVANLPDSDPTDGTQTQSQTYGTCHSGVGVVLYVIAGGGHTWPGGYQYGAVSEFGVTSQDFSANDVIWSFFAVHPAISSGAVPSAPAIGPVHALVLAGALGIFGSRLRRMRGSFNRPRRP